MTHSEYLKAFLKELDSLKPLPSWRLPHAITYDNSSICILVSLGDGHSKVYIRDLDQDPVLAASAVISEWQTELE